MSSPAVALPEVIQPSQGEVVEFGSFRHPETVMREAELVAATFAKRAERLQLYKKIGPSKHLLIEGWQTLAAMYRVTAGVVEDHYLTIGDAHGYEATAEAIFVPHGVRISTAKGMCLSDEENWGMRPKYEWKGSGSNREKVLVGHTPTPLQQIRSMAQTRACSKVLSNLLKWVARMGGFAGTPAEEISDSGSDFSHPVGESMPQRKSDQKPQTTSGENGAGKITEKQASRIWGLGNGAGLSKEQIIAIVERYGFKSAKDVTVDRYEALCSEIQASGQQTTLT